MVLLQHQKMWELSYEISTRQSCFLRLLRWAAGDSGAMYLLTRGIQSILNTSQQHSDSNSCWWVTAMMAHFFFFYYVFIGPLNLSKLSSSSIFRPYSVFSNSDNTICGMITVKQHLFRIPVHSPYSLLCFINHILALFDIQNGYKYYCNA